VQVPSASTIQSILRRHGRSIEHDAVRRPPHIRFERERPNELWQMDFKGHFPTTAGRCHPLTVLDDHSRYSLVLQACSDERGDTVQQHLTGTFRRYGRPEQMLMDNGPPWGYDETRTFTPLTVWLIRLGITPLHGRPYHPQTQGKEERFHRTLNLEVIRNRIFSGMQDVQRAFDAWRPVYNHERPHEALGMKPPISRFKPSVHSFPERLPTIEYGMNDAVRVPRGTMGRIAFGKREWKIGKAFRGLPVAVRPTATDGLYGVYFCHVKVRDIDLRATSDVT
jgi:transposase InsO family protein